MGEIITSGEVEQVRDELEDLNQEDLKEIMDYLTREEIFALTDGENEISLTMSNDWIDVKFELQGLVTC